MDRNDTTSYGTGLAVNCLDNIQISRAQILKHEEAEAMFDEAYTTHRQSLSIFTRIKGDFHHRTANSFHKLAFHRYRMHQYTEAEVFLRKALAIYEKGGVIYRNEIARSTYWLGCVLQDSGKITEGRKEVMVTEVEAGYPRERMDVGTRISRILSSSGRDDSPPRGLTVKRI